MSWTSRLGHNLGRFSPFTRSPPNPGSTTVSDADFSYITADDLRRHNAAPEDEDYGPPRDTDVLTLKNKRNEYLVHFPAYSIAKGELLVGQLRETAAKKLGASSAQGVKLLYKGKNLKDDRETCKREGLRDSSEVLCSVADIPSSASSSDDEESGRADGHPGETGKKKRNRGKKTKRRNKRHDASAPESGTSTPDARPAVPTTPLGKLDALHATLMSWAQQVREFKHSPPADPAKKEYEQKRLSESILTQVLLKLDEVDSEGQEEARARRKQLVKETQDVLHELDNAT